MPFPRFHRSLDTIPVWLIYGAMFATSIFINIAYWWVYDFQPKIQGDGHRTCSHFFTTSHSIRETVAYLFGNQQITRVSWDVPFCLVLDISSMETWLGVQVVLYALAVVLVYDTGARMLDRRSGVVSGLGLAFAWEAFRFTRRPQSDLVFIFAVCLALWAVTRYALQGSSRKKYALVGALLLLVTTRPFGVPILLGWLLGDALSDDDYRLGLVRSSRAVWLTIGALVAFMISFRLLGGGGFLTITRLNFYARLVNGVVVTHPTTPTFQYFYSPLSPSDPVAFLFLNADDLLAMGLLKIAWFFVPFLPRWSTQHVVINMVTLGPLIVATFVAVVKIVARQHYRVAYLWVVPLLMLLAPIAVLYLDGGFHWRAPAIPIFALLTGYVAFDFDVDRVRRHLPTRT